MSGVNWVLDERRFLSLGEVRRLLSTARKRKEEAEPRGRKVPVRDYFIVDLALSTGLRVQEIASLKCGDLLIDNGMSSVVVRNGKCGKTRVVRFGRAFLGRVLDYLDWKRRAGERVSPEAPLIFSSVRKDHTTTRGIQKAFKRCAARAGLRRGCSIHSLRHTYACHLYRASNYNLRLVQKQLGHSTVRTTEVYADVMNPDLTRALERLYV